MSAQSAPAAAQAELVEEPLVATEQQEELEQEIAEETEESEDKVDTELTDDALTPGLSQREREQEAHSQGEREMNATEGVPYSADRLDRQEAAARVRESTVLSPGMRERMAAVVEATAELARDGRTLVSLDDALRVFDDALPGALRLGPNDVQRPDHPGGSAFFRTTPAGEMSDDEANEIARTQLARSGLLRGPRVPVAQD